MQKALIVNSHKGQVRHVWPVVGCGWLLLAMLCASACHQPGASDTPGVVADLTGMKQTIRARFPGVRQVSTSELAGWLQQPNKPLLLDARAPAEYAVSHLPNARLAATEEQALAILQAEPRDRLVVAYCSVGYRSSALAEQLQRRGYTNVYNLEGSIFEWANEGRPLFRTRVATPSLAGSGAKVEPAPQGEQPAKQVHPYDARWGVYLKREYRAALP